MEALKGNHFLAAQELTLGYRRGSPLHPRPLSFALPAQHLVALIGPNGSGKSTLLRALIGEPTRLAGSLQLGIDGKAIEQISLLDLSQRVAFIPQEPRFPPHLTVVENLRLAFLPRAGWFGALPGRRDPALQETIEVFSLERIAERRLGELSAGERQRAFLARAFLQRTEILVLDEPTNHLDPKAAALFARALKTAQARDRRSLLLATHDLGLVRQVADWALALTPQGLHCCGALNAANAAPLFQELFEWNEPTIP